jgi:hypothetical protein
MPLDPDVREAEHADDDGVDQARAHEPEDRAPEQAEPEGRGGGSGFGHREFSSLDISSRVTRSRRGEHFISAAFIAT